jgi:hypothetical protein
LHETCRSGRPASRLTARYTRTRPHADAHLDLLTDSFRLAAAVLVWRPNVGDSGNRTLTRDGRLAPNGQRSQRIACRVVSKRPLILPTRKQTLDLTFGGLSQATKNSWPERGERWSARRPSAGPGFSRARHEASDAGAAPAGCHR